MRDRPYFHSAAPPRAAEGLSADQIRAGRQPSADTAGLKVTCLIDPNVLTSSKTCPVVVHQGITTWAHSFLDNRVCMALVPYDARGNIVPNVTRDGALRLVMEAGVKSRLATIFGQVDQYIEVPWDRLGR